MNNEKISIFHIYLLLALLVYVIKTAIAFFNDIDITYYINISTVIICALAIIDTIKLNK